MPEGKGNPCYEQHQNGTTTNPMNILTQNANTASGSGFGVRRSSLRWIGAGLVLVALHFALAWLSRRFGIETDLIDKPVGTLVALELAAGAVFLFVARPGLLFRIETRGTFAWILLVGFIMRGTMMHSSPMLETDFFRYLWDGAVVANGMNPYRYAPELAERSETVPAEMVRLAGASGDVIHRINHPGLRSIYPPVAQLAFAAAYFIKPWSLLAWRVILLLFDAGTAVLLLIALREAELPRQWLAVYWWNPLVVREVFNAAHMDVVALPLVIGALLVTTRGRHGLAAILLALGAGTKLWPAILLPIVCAPLWKTPDRLAGSVGLFALVCGLLLVPVHLGGFDGTSGFVAYGREWEMNDSLYMLLWWVAAGILKILALSQAEIHLAARMLSIAILGVLVALSCRNIQDPAQVWGRSLLVATALFMLSPAQFPWYYLWVVPFLVVRPRISLLLLGVLLPIYYVRFYFKARGCPEIFDNYLVWLEYVPAWGLLFKEWMVPSGFQRGKIAEGQLISKRHPPAPS
jgi:alpha-1,6-mannosyltransferase